MIIRFSHFSVILLCSIFLSACSGNKIVQAYEGKTLPKNAVAVLNAPENITILSVNDRSVDQYLLSNLDVNYALKAGKNVVLFQYESIWSKARRDEQTGSRVDVIKSEPLVALIPAKAGKNYTFKFSQAANVREARALIQDFKATVVDEKNQPIAESLLFSDYQAQNSNLFVQNNSVLNNSVLNGEATLKGESDGALSAESALQQLKSIWPTASAEEKKAFLAWVFQD